MGGPVKKISLLLIVAIFAAAPAGAAPKQKQKSGQMTYEEAMAYNRRNLGLLVEGLPLILPSWSLPIYFMMYKNAHKTQNGTQKKR